MDCGELKSAIVTARVVLVWSVLYSITDHLLSLSLFMYIYIFSSDFALKKKHYLEFSSTQYNNVVNPVKESANYICSTSP